MTSWLLDNATVLVPIVISVGALVTSVVALSYSIREGRRRSDREMAEKVYVPLQRETREVLEPFQEFAGPLIEEHAAFGGMRAAFAWRALLERESLLTGKVPAEKRVAIEKLELCLHEIFVARGPVGMAAYSGSVAASVRRFKAFAGYSNSWGSIMVNVGDAPGWTLLPEVLWFSEKTVDEWATFIATTNAPGRPWKMGVYAGSPDSLTDDAGLREYVSDIFASLEANPEASALREKVREARAIATDLDAWLALRIRAGH